MIWDWDGAELSYPMAEIKIMGSKIISANFTFILGKHAVKSCNTIAHIHMQWASPFTRLHQCVRVGIVNGIWNATCYYNQHSRSQRGGGGATAPPPIMLFRSFVGTFGNLLVHVSRQACHLYRQSIWCTDKNIAERNRPRPSSSSLRM